MTMTYTATKIQTPVSPQTTLVSSEQCDGNEAVEVGM